MIRPILLSIVLLLIFASCEKAENPVRLPERGSSIHSTPINMGETYKDQIFFDFSDNEIVYTSTIWSWDLAFETTPTGFHVFFNTDKYSLYNTKQRDLTAITTLPATNDNDWIADASCGLPDSTAIGDWRGGGISKNEVYIVKFLDVQNPKPVKFSINTVTEKEYTISFAPLESNDIITRNIPKEPQYNFSYYSFSDGIVFPEPSKDSWDIVFTRYQTFLIPGYTFYGVTGVLLNPSKVTAAKLDSNADYAKVDATILPTIKLSNHRDVIGHDWKTYNFSQSNYTINKNKVYIVKDRFDFYWKLHFLDFYDPVKAVRGSPSFEFERLQ